MKAASLTHWLIASTVLCLAAAVEPKPPAIGEPAPRFELKASDGRSHALSQYRGRIVVLEWSNSESPTWQRVHEPKGAMRIAYRQTRKIDEQVVWLAIDSTYGASARQMNAAIKHYEIDYPMLIDGDGSVGRSYDARRTPHMFVIDKEGKLAYSGALDDDPLGKKAEANQPVKNYIVEAVRALSEGKKVDPGRTRPYGSPIKYRAGEAKDDGSRSGRQREGKQGVG